MTTYEINKIDFSNEKDLESILSFDKHTRIEGLCSEALFVSDLLKPSFPVNSSGWWFTKAYSGRPFARKLLFDIKLSPLDIKILVLLSDHYQVQLFYFDPSKKIFEMVKFSTIMLADMISYWNSNKKQIPINQDYTAPEQVLRDPIRLHKAAIFLNGQKTIL